MTVDDIRPPPVPDADNAALVLEKIAPLLRALPQVDGKDFLMWFGDFQSKHKELHLDATATKELGDQLDSPPVQAVLALIREAAGKKEFNSNTDYSRGPQLFRYISPLQQSAKLLGGHARLAASRGQSGEAAADVWAMTSLAEFPAKEPPALITLLTRVAIWGITTAEMERLAVTGDLAPEWNQKFSARLAGINLSADLVRAFDVERIVFG